MTNPSFSYSSAYCTVNMFSAAFVILYAGAEPHVYLWLRAIEPRVVDLGWVSTRRGPSRLCA